MFRDQEVLIVDCFKAWIAFASTCLFWAEKYISWVVGTIKSIFSLLIIFNTASVSGSYSLHNRYFLKILCSLGIYCYLSSGSFDYEDKGQLLIFPGVRLWLFISFCWVGFLFVCFPPSRLWNLTNLAKMICTRVWYNWSFCCHCFSDVLLNV